MGATDDAMIDHFVVQACAERDTTITSLRAALAEAERERDEARRELALIRDRVSAEHDESAIDAVRAKLCQLDGARVGRDRFRAERDRLRASLAVMRERSQALVDALPKCSAVVRTGNGGLRDCGEPATRFRPFGKVYLCGTCGGPDVPRAPHFDPLAALLPLLLSTASAEDGGAK